MDIKKMLKKFNDKAKECVQCPNILVCPKDELILLADTLVMSGVSMNIIQEMLDKFIPQQDAPKQGYLEYI